MRITITVLAALALVACDDAAGPANGLTIAEIEALSDAMVQDDFETTGEQATAEAAADPSLALDPVTSTVEFSGSRSCPAGGAIAIEGTRTRTWDRDTRSGSADFEMTKTHQECARAVRDVVITLNGDPNVAVAAHHAWEASQRHGLQTLTKLGGFTWSTDDGRQGACTVDLVATFDPETSTRSISGTFCGRTIDRTVTWMHGA